jgi:transposase-like protein
MGLPVSGCGQGTPDRRFLLEPKSRCERSQGLSAQSDEEHTRSPTKITLDAYAASQRAVREMKEDGELPSHVQVRSSQYLNNLVEQDHRRVKQRIRPMLGFKRFDHAVITISGIELAEKIKKGQFKTGKLGGCHATMTELWRRRSQLEPSANTQRSGA